MPELIVPLFWYQEQSILSSAFQKQIKYLFVYPKKYRQYGIIGLFVFSLILLTMSCICFYYCFAKQEPDKSNSKAKVSDLSLSASTLSNEGLLGNKIPFNDYPLIANYETTNGKIFFINNKNTIDTKTVGLAEGLDSAANSLVTCLNEEPELAKCKNTIFILDGNTEQKQYLLTSWNKSFQSTLPDNRQRNSRENNKGLETFCFSNSLNNLN